MSFIHFAQCNCYPTLWITSVIDSPGTRNRITFPVHENLWFIPGGLHLDRVVEVWSPVGILVLGPFCNLWRFGWQLQRQNTNFLIYNLIITDHFGFQTSFNQHVCYQLVTWNLMQHVMHIFSKFALHHCILYIVANTPSISVMTHLL